MSDENKIDLQANGTLPKGISSKDDFVISDPEREKLYNQLLAYNSNAANAYKGALYNLDKSRKDNPDRLRQAAHSLRMLPGLITRTGFISGSSMVEKYKNLIMNGDPRGGAPISILDAVLRQLVISHDWFNKVSKIGSPESEITEADFYNMLGDLEEVLIKVTGNYFDIRSEIEKILKKSPTDELAKRLIGKIVFWRNFEFLFQQASADWLSPLYNAGFFCIPVNEQREWPPTKYLIRISKDKPDDVVKIIEEIAATKNPVVMSDFIDIALNVRPELAVSIVKIIDKYKWLNEGFISNYWFGHNAIKLVDYLAAGGKVDDALGLFSDLLRFELADNAFSYRSSKPLIRDYDYQELLENNIEKLFDIAPLKVINIIARKLNGSYKICYGKEKNYLKDKDYSYFDYREIDDTMDYSQSASRMLLRSLARRLEQLGKTSPDKLPHAITILDYPIRIFRMIKYRAYNKNRDLFKNEIRNSLVDVSNYDDLDDLGEPFVNMLKDNYEILVDSDKQIFLSIVNTCPKHISSLKDIDDKKKKEWHERWKYKILFPIKNKLDELLKQWVSNLASKYGAPEYDQGAVTSWVGPTSDLSVEDYNAMPVVQIIKKLVEWEPPKGFGVDSPEGRGRNLSESIKQMPEKYCAYAPAFITNKLRFTYIHHFFWGFELALRDKKILDWPPIIDAAVKYVELSEEEINKFPDKSEEFDYNYDGALRAIISLIDMGFNQEEINIQSESRKDIWKVISKGLKSNYPDLKHEKEYGGNNMDPYTMSINTTRGEAMHALIRYSSWVVNKIEKKRGLPAEALERLSFHLDYNNDPTETIHCLYGFYFPFLYYHNKDWVISNFQNIFPGEENKFLAWKAAFGAFLYRGLYVDLFPILSDQYKRAIRYVGKKEEKDNSRDSFTEKLADHIMLAVAHGAKGTSDIASLLFQSKNNRLLQHAIFFAGANILKPELGKIKNEKLPDPEKLKWIWESLLDKLPPEVAKGFGWWFIHSPYDRGFTIKQLAKTIVVTSGQIDAEHKINEELSKYVEEYPDEVIECAEQIIKGDIHGWYLPFRISDYISLFRLALKKVDPKLKEKISKLSDYLGKKGYDDFEEFINK